MDKKQILIVDDHAEFRKLFTIILEQLGYDVVEATTGLQALDRAVTARPDLIIMDIGLPKISGDEAIERLKANPSTSDIPIIVSTSHEKDSEVLKRAVALGAAEVLHKPVTFDALQEMTHRYLSSTPPSAP